MKKLPPFKDPGLDKVFSDRGVPMWPKRDWDKNPMTAAERREVLEKFEGSSPRLDREEQILKFLRKHQLFKYQTAEEIRTMRHKRKKR